MYLISFVFQVMCFDILARLSVRRCCCLQLKQSQQRLILKRSFREQNPLNAVVKRQRGLVKSQGSKVRVNETTERNNRERKTTVVEMSEIQNTKVLLV